MNELLLLLKAIACTGIFTRLYMYDWPKDARYRLGITTVAYVMMFCAGAEAALIAMGSVQAASVFEVVLLWSMFILIHAAKGNLARVLSVSDAGNVPRAAVFDRRKRH